MTPEDEERKWKDLQGYMVTRAAVEEMRTGETMTLEYAFESVNCNERGPQYEFDEFGNNGMTICFDKYKDKIREDFAKFVEAKLVKIRENETMSDGRHG